MTPERYQQASEIFERACELDRTRRHAFAHAECRDDADLLKLVLEMLAGDESSVVLTGSPALRKGLEQLLSTSGEPGAPSDQPVPETLGPYRIIRHIGRGGMGDVYEGLQESPHRSVALKLIRAGAQSPGLLYRFRREVEFLARLSHPGIAQVYDAGVADVNGARIPYFAMEYVRGKTLTQYASDHALSIPERLRLVASICDTVQFAHQQGVIHRDLKPANILVGEPSPADLPTRGGVTSAPDRTNRPASSILDALPLPRILDFGVARMADQSQESHTFATEAGQMIGTLGFMSPEQVRGTPGQVDTRSDIYALGVILYLLLSGKMPHAIESRSAFDAARDIVEKDPPRLGTLSLQCRGDLETIVATAMHKDRDRRYASASQLGADIRRYLANEPISARPATAPYLLRKFAARHKALVFSGSAFVLLLVAASVMIGLLYVREQRQRLLAVQSQAAAERESRQLQETVEFLVSDTFGEASPRKRGPSLRVVDVLDQAAAAVDERFKNDQALRGRIRSTVANLLFAAGQLDQAYAAINKATTELDAAGLGTSLFTIETLVLKSAIARTFSHPEEAEAALRDALSRCDHSTDNTDDMRAAATASLGECLQSKGKHDDAAVLFRSLIANEHPATQRQWQAVIDARVSLAASLEAQGRRDEVIPLLEQAVSLGREHLGPRSMSVLTAMNNLASHYVSSQQFEKAVPLGQDVIASLKLLYPENHPYLGFASITLSRTLAGCKRYAEAKPLALRGVEIFRSKYDDGDFNVERAADSAVSVFDADRDAAGGLESFKISLRARMFAAAVQEGQGVIARTDDLRRRLQSIPGSPSREHDADLIAFVEECRQSPLIQREGGIRTSPRAARFLANLCRAVWALHAPGSPAEGACTALLDDARAALPASQRPDEDSKLIEAVARAMTPATP